MELTATFQNGRVVLIDSAVGREVAAELGTVTTRRASHVLPVNALLRILFNVLRHIVTDDSRIAEWTRKWTCLWFVDPSPVGGDVLSGRWRDRASAVAAEVEYLNRLFLTR